VAAGLDEAPVHVGERLLADVRRASAERQDLGAAAGVLKASLEVRDLGLQAGDLLGEKPAGLLGGVVARLEVELLVGIGHGVGEVARQCGVAVGDGDVDKMAVPHGRDRQPLGDEFDGAVELVGRFFLFGIRAPRSQPPHGSRDRGPPTGDHLRPIDQIDLLRGESQHAAALQDLVLGLVEVLVRGPGGIRAHHFLEGEDVRPLTLDLQHGNRSVLGRAEQRQHDAQHQDDAEAQQDDVPPIAEDLPVLEEVQRVAVRARAVRGRRLDRSVRCAHGAISFVRDLQAPRRQARSGPTRRTRQSPRRIRATNWQTGGAGTPVTPINPPVRTGCPSCRRRFPAPPPGPACPGSRRCRPGARRSSRRRRHRRPSRFRLPLRPAAALS